MQRFPAKGSEYLPGAVHHGEPVPVSPPGVQQIARQLRGAQAGEGAHPWEPSVLIASTSATNLMCNLENATLQIPFGLLFIADCRVQLEACLSPGTDQGRRVDLNWTLLSAPQSQARPNTLHCTTNTESGGNENTQSPPRRSAGT